MSKVKQTLCHLKDLTNLNPSKKTFSVSDVLNHELDKKHHNSDEKKKFIKEPKHKK